MCSLIFNWLLCSCFWEAWWLLSGKLKCKTERTNPCVTSLANSSPWLDNSIKSQLFYHIPLFNKSYQLPRRSPCLISLWNFTCGPLVSLNQGFWAWSSLGKFLIKEKWMSIVSFDLEIRFAFLVIVNLLSTLQMVLEIHSKAPWVLISDIGGKMMKWFRVPGCFPPLRRRHTTPNPSPLYSRLKINHSHLNHSSLGSN